MLIMKAREPLPEPDDWRAAYRLVDQVEIYVAACRRASLPGAGEAMDALLQLRHGMSLLLKDLQER